MRDNLGHAIIAVTQNFLRQENVVVILNDDAGFALSHLPRITWLSLSLAADNIPTSMCINGGISLSP